MVAEVRPGRGRQAEVLVLEDDRAYATLVAEALIASIPRLRVHAEETAAGARRLLACRPPDAAVVDRSLPDGDGLDVMRAAMASGCCVPFVLLSGDGSAEGAVESLGAGAADYVVKGADAPHRAARGVARLIATGPAAADGDTGLAGASAAIERVRREIGLYAPVRSCVLVQGDTGVGKELVARALHRLGARASAPFVAVNCGALPEQLVESELFGHVRGAFTGAHRDHPGLVAEADGGTLFLDEVEDLPIALQGKLLRLLQEGEYRPVGAARSRRADVRIVAAANQDLRARVAERTFRKDLYFRLEVLRIDVPPLRRRLEDLPALVAHLAGRLPAGERPTPYLAPTDAQLDRLAAHPWSGNVRELSNLVARAAVHARRSGWAAGWAAAIAALGCEPPGGLDTGGPSVAADRGGASWGERKALEEVLARHRWRREEAARELGISRVTLWRRMRRLGLAC